MTEQMRGPILAVSVAVWFEGRILLIQRGMAPNKGLWALPGGKVKFGETLAEAAVREIQEETCLAVAPKNLFLIRNIRLPDLHYSLHCVTAQVLGGELAASDDAADAKWVDEIDLTQLATVPDLASSVALSKSGPFLPV